MPYMSPTTHSGILARAAENHIAPSPCNDHDRNVISNLRIVYHAWSVLFHWRRHLTVCLRSTKNSTPPPSASPLQWRLQCVLPSRSVCVSDPVECRYSCVAVFGGRFCLLRFPQRLSYCLGCCLECAGSCRDCVRCQAKFRCDAGWAEREIVTVLALFVLCGVEVRSKMKASN